MMRPTAIKGDHAVAYYDALVTDRRWRAAEQDGGLLLVDG